MKLAWDYIAWDIYECLSASLSGWSVYRAATTPQVASSGQNCIISSFQSIRHGSKNTDGEDMDVTLDFWFRTRKGGTVATGMRVALDLLDSYTYTRTSTAGWDVLAGFPRLAFTTILTENIDEGDPIVHGILRLRYLTHEQ